MFELLMLTSLVLAVSSQLLPEAKTQTGEEQTDEPEETQSRPRSTSNGCRVGHGHKKKPSQTTSARAISRRGRKLFNYL